VVNEPVDKLTDEERVLFGSYAITAKLAVRCRNLREMKVSMSDKALHAIVNSLMTEFWDQGFSQTEIRIAFMEALADMNRYAAGEERRS
jgi:hypothetical protein